jgi:hypothetical protein
LECFEAQNEQHLPLFWQESAKNSKQMLAGNVAKHKQSERKHKEKQRNFLHTNVSNINNLSDLF